MATGAVELKLEFTRDEAIRLYAWALAVEKGMKKLPPKDLELAVKLERFISPEGSE